MKVLVTGGAGYIGSHTCVELLEAGHEVVVVDNLYNSKKTALERVREISGKDLTFHEVDLCDRPALEKVFDGAGIQAAIHFAGYKAVGESVDKPLEYYHNNLVSSLNLCGVMREHGCKNLVFSSSATVYGDPEKVPITEDMPTTATNPYGWTKLIQEQIFSDLYVPDKEWNIALLRYFNPVGSHPSGKIGEDPNGIPNNLMPYISQVAVGKRKELSVFGSDYPTPDGTGVRDYIHVVDLAIGHLKALDKLPSNPGLQTWNLGTGRGYSVLEIVRAFEKACGKPIPYRMAPRRSGDIPTSYADPSKAEADLGWKATRGIDEICQDAWRWQSNNPDGFQGC